MGVVVKKATGKIKIDTKRIAEAAAAQTIAMIKDHTDMGLMVSESGELVAMPAYSASYKKQRERAGLNTNVALRVSGGMLKGIHEVSSETIDASSKVVIAPNAQSSTSAKYLRSKKAKRKNKGPKGAAPGAPPNNAVAYWHHTGTGNNPKRKFFMLSKKEIEKLKNYVSKMQRALKR